MTKEKTAVVAVMSGNFDKEGVGQEKLLAVLQRVKDILVVDRPEGPYSVPIGGPAQICLIVNPDGRELAKLRKDQLAIAVVDPKHFSPISLRFLGFDGLLRFGFGIQGVSIPGLHELLKALNDAIDRLNWRLEVLESKERFKSTNLTG